MSNVVAIKHEVEPESIEYGGAVWSGRADKYKSYCAGLGRFRVSQYTDADSYSFGKWHWEVDLSEALHKLDLRVAERRLWGIVDTREDAMIACGNAQADYLHDLREILLKLSPVDQYAKGFADGKAALAAKLQTEIDQAMSA